MISMAEVNASKDPPAVLIINAGRLGKIKTFLTIAFFLR